MGCLMACVEAVRRGGRVKTNHVKRMSTFPNHCDRPGRPPKNKSTISSLSFPSSSSVSSVSLIHPSIHPSIHLPHKKQKTKKKKDRGGTKAKHTQSTIIPRILACRTSSVKLDATDAADVVFGHVPAPGGDGVPFFDCDFHCFSLDG